MTFLPIQPDGYGRGIQVIGGQGDVPDDELSIELEGQPRSLLVHRYDDTVRVATIDEPQFAALQMLTAGYPLQAVCEALVQRSDGVGEDPPVMDWFAAWIGAGVIRRIEFSEIAR